MKLNKKLNLYKQKLMMYFKFYAQNNHILLLFLSISKMETWCTVALIILVVIIVALVLYMIFKPKEETASETTTETYKRRH